MKRLSVLKMPNHWDIILLFALSCFNFGVTLSASTSSFTEVWQELPFTNDTDYFGKLGSYYFDTRAVIAPSGNIITGLALTTAWDAGNRVSWVVTSALPDGTNTTTTIVSGSSDGTYFPNEGGGKNTYADSNAVVAPDSTTVVGVYLWNKQNRYAPGLVVVDEYGEQFTVENSHTSDSIYVLNIAL
ncbi:hypothetical protein GYMLUDRAFT_250427 [Collybiopsis luxurians FD-317 M1]|uniref:Uncharacterized protein n=1 Tax=Collybiopsis luxurians FD-317 M1 TaxID=944289 RepID=A0A0D0CE98_9AGAR|nr:hypothetical protein GYMLUDRAFT_250427 [Collybiopsis luxurians FD-317 M1]